MRTIKKFLPALLLLLLLLPSCEQDISVSLPTPTPKIVVEGFIESDDYPCVILTRSTAYFAPVDSNTLANSIITDATVIVSDGITTDTLLPTLDFSFYLPLVYKGFKIKGVTGTTYTLTVISGGNTVTAQTTIPSPVALDSLWFKVEGGKDSLGYIWAHLPDPDTLGNNYRWFAKRFGKDDVFIPAPNSVFEDKFFNGKKFDFAFDRGSLSNSDAPDDNNEEQGYFKKGDSLVVKFCTIDRAHFEFWRTLETEVQNNGNPFGSPTTIRTNINGGLGIWGGYGVTFDTLVAK